MKDENKHTSGGKLSRWREPFVWLLAKTRPYIRQILLLLLLDGLLTFIGIGVTLLNKHLIDASTLNRTLDTTGVALLIAMSVVSVGAGSLTMYLTSLIHEQFSFGVRTNVYDRLLRTDWLQSASYHSGDLVTRMTSDVDVAASGIAELIPSFIQLIIRLLAAFVVLYMYEPLLAVVVVLLAPLGMLFGTRFSNILRKYQRQLQDNESEYRGFLQESAANLTTVKAFEQEDIFSGKLHALRNTRLAALRKRNRLNAMVRFVTNGIFTLGYAGAFTWGIYRLSRGEITYGTLTLFLGLVSQIQGPIMVLPSLVPRFVQVLTCAGRAMEMDSLKQEPTFPAAMMDGPIGIQMDDVHFAYHTDEVLCGVSMEIPPSMRMGLVGESGAGKTTVVRLLLGLVTPGAGAIWLCDTHGNRQPVSASSRRYFAYVAQGNPLFSGSIADNLRIGNPYATEAEMEAALSMAEAGFVFSLEDGLNTILTERGGTLSEGQGQRIAIARAILRNRPILILDEATSALDLETEEAIIRNLKNGMAGVTFVIISHRHSLLRLCERCYAIQDGHIADSQPGLWYNEYRNDEPGGNGGSEQDQGDPGGR